MPNFATRYAPPAPCSLMTTQPSMVQLADFEDSKVGNILARHLPQPRISPEFGDFTETPQDFAEAYDVIARIEDSFSGLPSAVRDRFHNDPSALLEFLSRVENRDEAVRLGLLKVTPKGGSNEPLAPTPLDGIRPGDSTGGVNEQSTLSQTVEK